MSDFPEREQAFEQQFAHDEALKFRVEARRTKLVAAWVAGILGLDAAATAAYVQSLVVHDLGEAGSDDVQRKLAADLQAKGHDPQALGLEKKMVECLAVAKLQVMQA
jgi:hypothetical protein